MSNEASLLLAVLLLFGNAFFVGAEFAVLSARRSQIEPLAETSARARSALAAMEHVSLMLATCQLGVTLCSLGLGAVAEPAIASARSCVEGCAMSRRSVMCCGVKPGAVAVRV